MLSKCANPACDAKLRYLSEGKIFRVDTETLDHSVRLFDLVMAGSPKPIRSALPVSRLQIVAQGNGVVRAEYFWLCARCSSEMTIAVSNGAVLVASTAKKLRAVAS